MILLIADDDKTSRELLIEATRRVAPEVVAWEADNGVVLMQLLHSKNILPNLIFLDINMPKKNGIECLEEIRQTPRLKRLPVIIYSSYLNPDDVNVCFKKRANFYFEKPGSFKDLQYIIFRLLALDWSEPIIPNRTEFLLTLDYFK